MRRALIYFMMFPFITLGFILQVFVSSLLTGWVVAAQFLDTIFHSNNE